MKSTLIALALSAVAFAAPASDAVAVAEFAQLQKRQYSANEFSQGPCRDIIFFFARGSTEQGNLGGTVGPAVSAGLKSAFGSNRVASEGVQYDAGLGTNFLPGGADPVGVANMNSLFKQAAVKCPDSVVVASGYSQGAAVAHRAIETLSGSVMNQIVGVVTFGDTQNLQDGGRIRNYPREDLLVICNPGDLVCSGTLIITAAHLAYVPRAPEGVSFLAGKIRAAGK